jgi:hypothetical protein
MWVEPDFGGDKVPAMTEAESVLSPRAQTIAVIVGAVTLLLSIGISSFGPLVWLVGVTIAVVVVVRKGRRLERARQIDRDADDLRTIMAAGRPPAELAEEAMVEATNNLARSEAALSNVRFDGVTPMFVNDLRKLISDYHPTNDPTADALRARRIAAESRDTLSHVASKRSGNFLRMISAAAGVFSQRD